MIIDRSPPHKCIAVCIGLYFSPVNKKGFQCNQPFFLQAAQELASGLERQIASLVGLAAGVENCTVEVSLNADLLYDAAEQGGWHNWGQVIIVLTVEQARQEQAENIGRAVRQTVADFYDIEPAAVQVSIANYQSSNLAAENIKAE